MSSVDAPPTSSTERPAGQDLLFDISNIDLTGRALTRADLERWNPHRGEIVQVDGVVWHDEGLSRALGIKHVREDEFWVKGHFPGRPIMPGVLMVEAGAQLSSFLFYARRGEPCIAGFTRIDDTVFRNSVSPGEDLLLLCQEVRYRPRRFISDIQGVVGDRIIFSSRITGMVLPEPGGKR